MIDRYLELGWHIFPIQRRTKIPHTKQGVLDASPQPATIDQWRGRWPDCGWGLAAGQSGLLVVDLDGDDGIASWRRLLDEHGATPTLTSRTGGGGYHLIYRDTSGDGRNSASLIAPRVDTRGRGGYIVLPPSIHPNGTRYQWARHAPIATAPEWILAQLRPKPVTRIAAPTLPPSLGETAFGRRSLDGILRCLSAAQDHERHNLNYWAAVRAGQLYAAGHVDMRARGVVLAAAHQVRRDQARAERDTAEGWAWGTANPGDYPAASATFDAPRIPTPGIGAAR